MDGIKKKPFTSPQPTIRPRKPVLSGPYAPRKEELFISSTETGTAERDGGKPRKRNILKRILFYAALFIAAASISYAAYFSWKTYSVSKQINSNNSQTTLAEYARTIASPIIPTRQDPLRGEETGRVNILLLGAAGEHKPGGNLTDTVMVASIDTKNNRLALLSLPRDLYVQIPGSQSYAKINSLYPIGIKQGDWAGLVRKAVEKITGLSMDYYVALDFDGFKKIIDDIGGINIMSERDIYDARYPGPNYSYETFSLSKGFHTLDGATALKYVRERHNDPEGDFGRAKRQQQVIQAVKNKLFSVKTLFNVVALNNILGALGESVRTDIMFGDLDRFVSLSQKIDMQNITNVVADAWKKDSLLKVSHVAFGNVQAFILVPRVGNYSEIQDLARSIFDQTELKKRADAIAREDARIGIIDRSGDGRVAREILGMLRDKLGLKGAHLIQKPAGPAVVQTTAADNSKGAKLFTLDELVKKIPATLDSQAASAGETSTDDDIIITLGSDLADIYKYEEDTMQDLLDADENQENMGVISSNQ